MLHQAIYSRHCPQAQKYKIFANGTEVFLYDATTTAFAVISTDEAIEIKITSTEVIPSVQIHPGHKNIEFTLNETSFTFSLPTPFKPENYFIHLGDEIIPDYPICIFLNPLVSEPVNKHEKDTIYFEAGRIVEIESLELKDNQILYLEEGAVLRGSIHACEANNITIKGRGIIDGGCSLSNVNDQRYLIVLEKCRNINIQDVVLIEPTFWILVLGACEHVHINGVREIGYCNSSDGVDVAGSNDVLIENMFIRNNDDCIAIKALNHRPNHPAKKDWSYDVANVTVRDCLLFTDQENGGSIFEIGFELQTEKISDILFQNCDVIAVHGFGCVFGIHNGDRATIENIYYKDIRIHHFFDKLIDLKVLHSPRWNIDDEKGEIKNIFFSDIYARLQPFNPGYSHSLIGGWEKIKPVKNIYFKNFYIGETKVRSEKDLSLFSQYAEGIYFE